MRSSRSWAAMAAGLLLSAAALLAADQPASPATAYAAAVRHFQSTGDPSAARRLSTAWTRAQFESAIARTRDTAPHLSRAASVLQLELALTLAESAPDDALFHLGLGERLLAALASEPQAASDDFVARWSVVASSIFQARTDLPRARTALALGRTRRSSDARVRLSAGTIEDLASLVSEDQDTGLADRRATATRRDTVRFMAAAEREYRAALGWQPDLAPARIRLGRLLHRRARFVDARRELETAAVLPLATGDRYLLRLFLAATYDALGDIAAARAHLRDAVREASNRQTGWIALAQLEARSGRPDDARGVIAQSLRYAPAPQTDEWWDYRHGGFDMEGMAWLRRLAASSR